MAKIAKRKEDLKNLPKMDFTKKLHAIWAMASSQKWWNKPKDSALDILRRWLMRKNCPFQNFQNKVDLPLSSFPPVDKWEKRTKKCDFGKFDVLTICAWDKLFTGQICKRMVLWTPSVMGWYESEVLLKIRKKWGYPTIPLPP